MSYGQVIFLKVLIRVILLIAMVILVVSFAAIGVIIGAIVLLIFCIIGRTQWHVNELGMRPWQSLLPFYSSYKEYSIGWNGWFGVAGALMPVGIVIALFFKVSTAQAIACAVMGATFIVLRMIESYKLRNTYALNGRNWFFFGLFRGIYYIALERRNRKQKKAQKAVINAMNDYINH